MSLISNACCCFVCLAYNDMDTLLRAIKKDVDLDGVIIDLYAASFYLEKLHSFRIQRVFEDVSSYGVVLRTRTIKLQKCLVQYVLSAQRTIYEDIRAKFPPLKVCVTNDVLLINVDLSLVLKAFICSFEGICVINCGDFFNKRSYRTHPRLITLNNQLVKLLWSLVTKAVIRHRFVIFSPFLDEYHVNCFWRDVAKSSCTENRDHSKWIDWDFSHLTRIQPDWCVDW